MREEGRDGGGREGEREGQIQLPMPCRHCDIWQQLFYSQNTHYNYLNLANSTNETDVKTAFQITHADDN